MYRYEWFARADDDVYIRGVELAAMLRSLDSGKAHYIGQPGQGRPEDIGRLAMSQTDNFCMGGTVYIMSRQTLRLIGPHISTCLRKLYSVHDDVEIGRCVRHYAGISCTWAYEVSFISERVLDYIVYIVCFMTKCTLVSCVVDGTPVPSPVREYYCTTWCTGDNRGLDLAPSQER